MKFNKTLFLTTIGVIFEKIFPLLISFIFINKIADAEYGLWIICFQFFLIFNSSIATPLTLNFNKNFFTSPNKKINISEARLIISLILLSFTVLLLVPNASPLIAFLVTVMICCSVFTLLIFNYLRYSEQNLKYALYSGIRFFLFLIFLIFFGFDSQLEVKEILISLIISNILPFISFIKLFKITLRSIDFKNEFLKLSFYGIATFFLSGIDRAVLGFYGYDLASIATIGYAATIAMEHELVKTIITFETPSGTEWIASSDPRKFTPNLFFEVSEENLDAKIKGMESYEFEKRIYPHPRSPEALMILAQYRGNTVGKKLAEAFEIIRIIH